MQSGEYSRIKLHNVEVGSTAATHAIKDSPPDNCMDTEDLQMH